MKIVGLDLETTGLFAPEHRIIEVYAGVWDSDTRKLASFINQRIDPERSIMAEAQRVHGISLLDLVGKPKFKDVAPALHGMLARADLLVAHNGAEFDLPFLNMEFKRVGLSKIETPMFDTMTAGRWATAFGKVPNLGELCFACDVSYDTSKAHAASYDVDVMMECFFKGIEWHNFELESK